MKVKLNYVISAINVVIFSGIFIYFGVGDDNNLDEQVLSNPTLDKNNNTKQSENHDKIIPEDGGYSFFGSGPLYWILIKVFLVFLGCYIIQYYTKPKTVKTQ